MCYLTVGLHFPSSGILVNCERKDLAQGLRSTGCPNGGDNNLQYIRGETWLMGSWSDFERLKVETEIKNALQWNVWILDSYKIETFINSIAFVHAKGNVCLFVYLFFYCVHINISFSLLDWFDPITAFQE